MRFRAVAMGGAAAAVLATFIPAAHAGTWPTGAGGGATTAAETLSRYGSSADYSMHGVLAIGARVYRGPMTLSVSWGFSAPSGTLQGSSGGHTVSGTCVPTSVGESTVTDLLPVGVGSPAALDSYACSAQIDAAQTQRLTIAFALAGNPTTPPCLPPASTCDYSFVGTFTAG